VQTEPNNRVLSTNWCLPDLGQDILASLRRGRRLGCLNFPKRMDLGLLLAMLDRNLEWRQRAARFERMLDVKRQRLRSYRLANRGKSNSR
jgi:hypothetical protein